MAEMRRPVTGRKGDEESTASGEGNGSALEGAEDLAARGDVRAAKVADEREEYGKRCPGVGIARAPHRRLHERS